MRLHVTLAALALFVTASALAQVDPAPQLSPQAAYDDAIRPVEIVHRSVSNWSDSEQESLAVAVKSATAACATRKATDFSGDQLIALARLCSLGLNWLTMDEAATRYIGSTDAAKPQLTLAYGLKLEAALHLHDNPQIVETGRALLHSVPYDATADAAMNEALDYLRLAYPGDALVLYGVREPVLLAALASDHPLLPAHILYADGVAFAAHMRFDRIDVAPQHELDLLDAALPANLPTDETIAISNTRRLYALVGKPLPAFAPTLSLYDVRETPRINSNYGAATALVLFPDWCAQCVRLGPLLWNGMTRLGMNDIHLYGLLAEATPDKAALLNVSVANTPANGKHAAAPKPQPTLPKTPAEQLLHTPSLVVPTATLDTFAAADFPFLVVVDHAGIVRFAGPAPETLLADGDFVDRVTSRVASQWPRTPAVAPKGSPVVQ